MWQPKFFISVLILLAIGLHTLPVLQELQGQRQTFWPFMAWAMYRHSYDSRRPIQATTRHLISITARGEVWTIEPAHAGLGYFGFMRLYHGPMANGDAAAAQRLATQLNQDRDDPVVAFRLEHVTYMVTRTGVVKEEKPVVIYRIPN